MVEKLYLFDSYLKRTNATVLKCEKASDGYEVELNRTVLYPEGGGQPYDTGKISGSNVIRVREEGERVLHTINEPVALMQTVDVELDWQRRFDHMQQHSGEHLLSFAAKELFGAINVGFHMAASYCTVDFDREFTQEEMLALETRTNELIYANLPVEITNVQADALSCLELRKCAKGLSGNVRIISMRGGDSCTCCGTHVKNTGEIGALLITAQMHYKGGERITFVAGSRALAYAQHVRRISDSLARSFSCKLEDVQDAVEKLELGLSTARRNNKLLYSRLSEYVAKELLSSKKKAGSVHVIVRYIEDLPAQMLRQLANTLCQSECLLTLLFAKADDDSLHYVLCSSDGLGLNISDLMQAVNAAAGGKGGGRGTLGQGSTKMLTALDETLAQLEDYFLRLLKDTKRNCRQN